jgi:hypothetical protein
MKQETFEKKYLLREESKGYVRMIQAIHQRLDELSRELDDPDTEDWRIEEIFEELESLRGANIVGTAAAAKEILDDAP